MLSKNSIGRMNSIKESSFSQNMIEKDLDSENSSAKPPINESQERINSTEGFPPTNYCRKHLILTSQEHVRK